MPIIEPEILMDGDHDLATAVKWNVKVQSAVVKAMHDHKYAAVAYPGCCCLCVEIGCGSTGGKGRVVL